MQKNHQTNAQHDTKNNTTERTTTDIKGIAKITAEVLL